MKIYSRSLCFFLCCLALGVSCKYVYYHDETVWTKQNWDSLKLRFPLEKMLREKDLQEYELISSSGTVSKENLLQAVDESKKQMYVFLSFFSSIMMSRRVSLYVQIKTLTHNTACLQSNNGAFAPG